MSTKKVNEVNINVNKKDMSQIPSVKRNLGKDDSITVTDDNENNTWSDNKSSTGAAKTDMGKMHEDTPPTTSNAPTDAPSAQPGFGNESGVVSAFFQLLDKNATIVNAANKIRTPNDKVMMATEFIKRLKMDKAALSHLRSEMSKTIGENINPKMKKNELVELVNKNNQLEVIETIKVKNLKK